MTRTAPDISLTALHKTDTARRALAHREPMPAALRMWLITVDGRRADSELLALAQRLGLDGPRQVQALLRRGWLARPGAAAAPTVAPEPPRRNLASTRQLADAKMFAIDLVSRMMAGREGELRDAWRQIVDRESFQRWLTDCDRRLRETVSDERAALIRAKVQAVAEPVAAA